MLRYLQVQELRPVKATFKAGEAMTQGMGVSLDLVNDEADKATGVGDYLVDVVRNYNGVNAAIQYEDDHFESIAQGDRVLIIQPAVGDVFATNQLTIGSLTKGDPLKVAGGLFVAATSTNAYQWVYGGTFSDPTGTLYIVERVPAGTV